MVITLLTSVFYMAGLFFFFTGKNYVKLGKNGSSSFATPKDFPYIPLSGGLVGWFSDIKNKHKQKITKATYTDIDNSHE